MVFNSNAFADCLLTGQSLLCIPAPAASRQAAAPCHWCHALQSYAMPADQPAAAVHAPLGVSPYLCWLAKQLPAVHPALHECLHHLSPV